MQPIICPQCQTEVIPHETHLQRWEDCLAIFMDKKYDTFVMEDKVKMACNFFNELNDFIISENIHQSQLETARLRSKGASDNIKKYQEANKPKEE